MIAANRRNALRSTGPKSVEGKATVRMNAMKHGGRAELGNLMSADDRQAYELHIADTIKAWQPNEPVAEALVRQIAEVTWRLEWTNKAEAGQAWAREADPELAGDASVMVDHMLAFIKIELKLSNRLVRLIRMYTAYEKALAELSRAWARLGATGRGTPRPVETRGSPLRSRETATCGTQIIVRDEANARSAPVAWASRPCSALNAKDAPKFSNGCMNMLGEGARNSHGSFGINIGHGRDAHATLGDPIGPVSKAQSLVFYSKIDQHEQSRGNASEVSEMAFVAWASRPCSAFNAKDASKFSTGSMNLSGAGTRNSHGSCGIDVEHGRDAHATVRGTESFLELNSVCIHD